MIGDGTVVVNVKVFGPMPGAVLVGGPLNWILKNCFGDTTLNWLKSMMPVALFPEAEVSFNWPTKSSSPSLFTPVKTKAKSPAKVAGETGPAVWARRVPSLVILVSVSWKTALLGEIK